MFTNFLVPHKSANSLLMCYEDIFVTSAQILKKKSNFYSCPVKIGSFFLFCVVFVKLQKYKKLEM